MPHNQVNMSKQFDFMTPLHPTFTPQQFGEKQDELTNQARQEDNWRWDIGETSQVTLAGNTII